MNFRRGRAAAERMTERRRREDEAPRLAVAAPELATLKLEMNETRNGVGIPDAAHIKRVVVEHAPALFLMPCGESSCREGEHDITRAVLRGIEQKMTTYEGDDPCSGQTGSAPCTRTLTFTAHATYK